MNDYLFTTRQVGNILPALLGRTDGEENAFGERVEAVHQFQLRIPSEGDHLVHFLQFHCDCTES